MAPDRRRQLLLAALVVALAAVVYWQLQTGPGVVPLAAPSDAGRAAPRPAPKPSAEKSLDIHLKALSDDHPKPATSRNLFRFKPKPVALPPEPEAGRRGGAPAPPPGPPPPPPIPPIPLKFIGIVESADRSLRVAVLRDMQGRILNGSEGAIIDGRYQILRIGTESIDMANVDGSGRQTIRLSGS